MFKLKFMLHHDSSTCFIPDVLGFTLENTLITVFLLIEMNG